MNIPYKPSAFPVNTANLGGSGSCVPDHGMTLHDYVAAKAAASIIGAIVSRGLSTSASDAELVAKSAFAIADAFMAERHKQTEGDKP